MPGLRELLLIVGVGAGVLGLVGGAFWYVNDSAYNRGVADRDRQAVEKIAEDKKATDADRRETERMTDEEIDAWFRKKCLEAGGSAGSCG